MHTRNHDLQYKIDNWGSFSGVDSFSSLGHAVVWAMSDKVTAPIVFAVDLATKGLKMAISEIRN